MAADHVGAIHHGQDVAIKTGEMNRLADDLQHYRLSTMPRCYRWSEDSVSKLWASVPEISSCVCGMMARPGKAQFELTSSLAEAKAAALCSLAA